MSSTEGFRADWAEKDFYAVLGVEKSSDAAEIKKAYRKLARENHPDSNPGDEAKAERFKAVAEAYDVLGDPDKRAKYDEMRALYASGGTGGFGATQPGGFDLNDLFGDRRGGGGFSDVFGDMFGAARRAPRPRKGQDVESAATISFIDAIEGVTISLRLTSDAPCATCKGSGGKPGTKPHVCPVCDGAGTINNSVGGAFSMSERCPACGGRQLLYDEPCPTCGGSGRGKSSRTIQARIPAGVKDGQKIRVKGKGGPGDNGGPAGDLIVTVKVAKHPIFGRTGDNLTIDVPISFDEAALGAAVKIPTLGGMPVTLKVPAGTPTGRTFRVRGKGVTRRDGTKGDLLATVEVQVPATLEPAAREAIEAYREATPDRSLRKKLFQEE